MLSVSDILKLEMMEISFNSFSSNWQELRALNNKGKNRI